MYSPGVSSRLPQSGSHRHRLTLPPSSALLHMFYFLEVLGTNESGQTGYG